VKRSLCGAAALALFAAVLSGLSARQKTDLNQPQSPRKPLPDWVKYVDQGVNDPRLKGYITPEGLKVEIVAEEPVVINPVGMTFGLDGTLYVLEWVPADGANFPETFVTFTYRDGSKRKVAIMRKPVRDLVKVLSDGKGRGTYDQARVVLQDELPSSILLHDGWLYLSGQGTVRRYKMADIGDVKKPLKAEVIAQGFCGFHHHQVSGLAIGNDGWLYITSGDDDNYVEGSDGSRATVLRTGAVFRCRPDGSRMHVYSMGYRNPYRDVAFDATFNIFHADNDNEDGSKFMGCRLMHVAEGSDFGWRLRQGARCCVPDHVRGAAFGELPGKLAPLLKTGRGAPAGLLIYNDTRFPEPYRGLLYYPDVFRKLIRAYQVEPAGSTFEVTHEFEFLKSNDPLFRPCQMVLGPDGAMYICDWRTDSGGAGRLWGDGKHGRIYRVSWAGTPKEPALPLRGLDSWAKLSKQTDAELLKALDSPEFSDRLKAQQELVRRGDTTRPALLKVAADGERPLTARIAALGALQSFWNDAVEAAFCELLLDPNHIDVRRLAAEGLGLNSKPGNKEAHEALVRALDEQDPSVRRALVLAIGRINAPGAADTLVSALQADDGRDSYLRDAIARALEYVGPSGVTKLLALSDSGVDRDRDRVVEVFLTLRTRPAAEALPTLLKNYHLTAVEKAGLLRSYNNYLLDPPISMKPVVDFLSANPKAPVAVKLAGLEVLSSAGALRDERVAKLLLAWLDETDAGVRLSVVKAIQDTRLVQAAPRLTQLLGDAALPASERTALVRALGTLQDRVAAPALRAILTDPAAPTPEGAILRLESLRALGVIDPPAAQELATAYLDKGDPAMRKEAVLVLGTVPAGAKLIGQRYLDRKLPRELLPQVADALRTHAGKNAELERLLTEVMKGGLLLSLEKAEMERVRKLVQGQGNPRRGRELYLNHKALACITCHRLEGVGGNVGPDLTRLWDTMTVEKIMEAIIDPSKEIKEGYQSYIATTKGGQVFAGLKVAQSADEVVLRDATAREIRIAAKDLEELTASKKSLMPDDVVKHLTFNQFLDLVAFLKDRGAQESLRGLALEFWVVGPFGADLKAKAAPEANPDPAATYEPESRVGLPPGAKPGSKLAWQAQQADPKGYLNLRALFQRERASAYALTNVYSPKAQTVQLLTGSAGSLRVWLNGRLVHEHAAARPARADEDQVAVILREGWNSVLVKVAGAGAEHGLYLRFTGGEGLRLALRRDQ
jgi:putative membrane-bound dehydrogenase-like protein